MPRTLFLFFNVNCHLCGCDIRRGLSSFQWLLSSMFLTIVDVLCPALLATDCRTTSPRLVHFADTTLPFDGNSHVRSCRVVLHIFDHILALSHCLLTVASHPLAGGAGGAGGAGPAGEKLRLCMSLFSHSMLTYPCPHLVDYVLYRVLAASITKLR